jgi:hypothetical protein
MVVLNSSGLIGTLRKKGVVFKRPDDFFPPERTMSAVDLYARDVASFARGHLTEVDGIPLEPLFSFMVYICMVDAVRCNLIARRIIDVAQPERIEIHSRLLDRPPLRTYYLPEFLYLPWWLRRLGEASGAVVECPAVDRDAPARGPGPALLGRRRRVPIQMGAIARLARRRVNIAFLDSFGDYETVKPIVREMRRRHHRFYALHLNDGILTPIPFPSGLHLDPLSLVGPKESDDLEREVQGATRGLRSNMLSLLATPFQHEGVVVDARDALAKEIDGLAQMLAGVLERRRGVLRVFELFGPRALFMKADWVPWEALVAHTARRLGCRVVVLQHGVYTDYSYGGFTACPRAADLQFIWGDHTKRQELAQGVSPDRLVVTGAPKYERLQDGTWRPDKRIGRLVERERAARGAATVVLYMPSPYICEGASASPLEKFVIVEDLAGTLASHPDVLVIVKLHPSDNADTYVSYAEGLGARNLVVLTGDALSFIHYTDVVISHYSGTGIEAVLLGKPVLQIQYVSHPDDLPLARLGAALPVRSRDDLERLYGEYIAKRRIPELRARLDPKGFLEEVLNVSGGGASGNAVDALEAMLADRTPGR